MLTLANGVWGARCGESARRVLLGETRSSGHAYSVRGARESAALRQAPHRLPSSRLVSTNPFDLWMARTHPDLPWCRYADDGLVHCRNEQEAQALKSELQARLAECRLEMHPTKTKIVYCKDKKRKGKYPNVKFDFLGYCFRPRLVRRFRDNSLFCGLNPAVSSPAMKAMRSTIRELQLRHQTQLSLQDIARRLNPLLRGWIEYYGRYAPSALYPLLRHVNQTLVAWAMRKFKRFKGHKVRASQFLQQLAAERTALFVHWDIGMTGTFA